MSGIHYFQRYSQKENVVTNNTLLLFSRLYNHNPARFEDFLNALIDDSNLTFNVGVQFAQQTGNRKGDSVPDGLLTQKSMKIVVETKLYGNYGLSQLTKHLSSFKGEERQVLLLLDPRPPSDALQHKVTGAVEQYNQEHHQNITCFSSTFAEIIKHFDSILFDYDLELKDILQDYRDFCDSMSLIPRDDLTMRALVTGQTFDENMQFGVYYDPVEWGFAKHGYVGLYRQKSIRGIGKLTKIVHASYCQESRKLTDVEYLMGGELTEDEERRVINIMHAAKDNRGWDIFTGYKFFIVDGFEPTNYNKATKYPIQRSKFFDLGELMGTDDLPSVKEIADTLREQSWS